MSRADIDIDSLVGGIPRASDASSNGAMSSATDGALSVSFIDWKSFFAADRSEPEWLLDGVLARGRGHSLYAKHGTGKSLFTLWAATRIVEAGGVVLYADYEQSEDDLYERLSDMGYSEESDLEAFARLRYLLLPTIRPLDTPDGAQDLLAVLDLVRADYPDRHVCVVIDTIGRAVIGEENSNDTIIGFFRHTGMGLKQRGVTWLRIDHTGHEGQHARGGSAKGDDVDVVWRLTATDGGVELRADKRRVSWVPEKVAFNLRTDPILAYERTAGSWPAGTQEVAADLDRLGVPAEAGMRAAKKALKGAELGRANKVVEAAQRWRRMEAS